MRRLIMWNMVTLDGFFEGPAYDISWFVFDDELEKYIKESQSSADTMLFGRRTYEMMAAYWPSAEGEIADFMNRVHKVIFSRTLSSATWNNTRLVKENVASEVSDIKNREGGDIFLCGSANLASTLIDRGLVDEYRFGINPVMLGKGSRLFGDDRSRMDMKLLEHRTLGSGVVILHYEPLDNR